MFVYLDLIHPAPTPHLLPASLTISPTRTLPLEPPTADGLCLMSLHCILPFITPSWLDTLFPGIREAYDSNIVMHFAYMSISIMYNLPCRFPWNHSILQKKILTKAIMIDLIILFLTLNHQAPCCSASWIQQHPAALEPWLLSPWLNTLPSDSHLAYTPTCFKSWLKRHLLHEAFPTVPQCHWVPPCFIDF